MEIALVVLASISGAPASQTTGSAKSEWVQPPESSLKAIYGIRWRQELTSFQLFATNHEQWTEPEFSEDGSKVFIGTRTGRFEARAVEDGKLLWHKTRLGVIGTTMLSYGASIHVGIDSDLVAFDQVRGIERWRVRLGGKIGGRGVRAGDIGVFPVRPNAYAAVNLSTGERIWQIKRPTPTGLTIRGQAPARIDAERGIVYLGFSDGRVMAVSLDKGVSRWTTSLGKVGEFFSDVDTQPALVDKGTGVIVGVFNSGLVRLNTETGAVVWQKENLRKITALTSGPKDLLIASQGDGETIALQDDATVVWRYRTQEGAPRRVSVIDSETLAVAFNRGPIALLNTKTGKPVQLIPTGSGLSVPPAISGDNLVLLSNGGFLVALKAHSGGNILVH